MRMRSAIMIAAILTAAVAPAFPETPEEAVKAQLRETAIESLLSERGTLADFNKVVDAARVAGIHEQSILEARFLYHVDKLEDEALAAMLPEFTSREKQFKLEESAIFATEEDWLAVVEYVRAIAALGKGDKAGFKKHITEAFWLGPRQAAAFAPQIERLRHEEAMAAITIDFNTPLTNLSGTGQTLLKQQAEGKRALLLHFWSPQSRECEMSLPDFAKSSRMLEQHRIASVSITPEASPLARGMAQPYQQSHTGAWTIDSDTSPLARLLRVHKLPTMTLINPEGKILFSGDPTDEQFWNTLQRIDHTITRPKSDIQAVDETDR